MLHSESEQSKFVNGFLIKSGLILIITWFKSIVFSSNYLDKVQSYDHTSIDEDIKRIYVCSHDIQARNNGYLISCGVNRTNFSEDKFVYSYKNSNDLSGKNISHLSLILRCTLQNHQFRFISKQNHSLLLKDEIAEALLEYAEDKLIISL